ncbi:MAG: GNAT family N-acetyltransferase [Terriglobales bacterium]
MHIVFETPRLILRQFVPEDADALAQVISDPATMRYYPAPFDRAGVEEWIARNVRRYAADGCGLWALDLKSSGEMIGDCGITLQELDGEHLPEIGYHVRRDMWGQGLATEAARACRDYGFTQLQMDSLISLIRPENAPSRRVAEKNAMKVWKKTSHSDMLHLVYRIQQEEWRTRSPRTT